MDIFIKNEKNEKTWQHAKSILDSLKSNELISVDEWYSAILFARKKINLPVCENVLSLSQK